jgi:hypothetical protein
MYGLIYGKLGNKIFRRAHTRAGLTSVAYDYFVPHDPKSEKQKQLRLFFSQGMRAWQALSEPEKEAYRAATKRLPLCGHNLFLKFFLAEQKRNAGFVLVADWQRELQQKALQWAVERVLEQEAVVVRF